MTPRAKAALLFIGVFALGGAAGAGASRAYMWRQIRPTMDAPFGEARARFRLQAMQRQLDLSSEQLTKVEAILRDAEAERERLLSACQPGLDELRQRTEAQILEVLRPEQRDRYRELARHRGPPGRRGPGHPEGPPH
jgi:Spy/CpxP family protein refolding chaperone